MYVPKWCMSTIPHSGTRYVRDAFEAAGEQIGSTRKLKSYREKQYDFMWGHLDTGHEEWMTKVDQNMPDIRHFVVARNPIHMLCTHYHTISSNHPEKRIRRCNVVRNNLALYTRIQADYLATHDPYIHMVEDPLRSLGNWAGVELKDNGPRYSRPNDLREAVNARDADLCFQTIRYSNLWDWFTTTHSRNIAPLYRDQLGYDFWWYNG